MSWYNTYSDTTKRLEQLIDSHPLLEQLLQFPDFLELLRAYQPKLLEYISSSSDLPRDMIKYIATPPLQTDSDSRKYRLPLLTMMMIESNTTCVINSFFKIDPLVQQTYFINAFNQFLSTDNELMPLLCGYFSQFNLILWNNKYKETIDLVYQSRQPLFLLTKHCYSKANINTLLLYLNLDLTRNSNAPPDRTVLKLQILKILLEQVRQAFEGFKKQGEGGNHETIVQNIGQVLVEIVEKYYLIADGKSMLELVTNHQSVSLLIDIFMYGGAIAMSISNVIGWLMRYYCLSSFNTEDPLNAELNRRNQERLQMQPFPKLVIEILPKVVQMIENANPVTIYHSRLLQIFNMALQLSSNKLYQLVKKIKYLQMLISLLFRFPQLSIIHKLVEKVFYQIFNSDRLIFEKYRKYLFVQAGLIQLTVGNYLSKITDFALFRDSISSLHQGYFSYLMRIIKIYSKVQTNDVDINQSIMKRSVVWQKFSSFILKPYEALSFKDLGSYENTLDKPPVQYNIKCISGGLNTNQQISKKVLEEINQQQSMQKFKQNEKPVETKNSDMAEDNLFNVQQFNSLNKVDESNTNYYQTNIPLQGGDNRNTEHSLIPHPNVNNETLTPRPMGSPHPPTVSVEQPPKLQQPQPIVSKYSQFISTKKQEVDKEIKLQRTNSSEKRLSANKSRVTSPSPKKKRWDDNGSQQEEKVVPKLAPAPKVVAEHEAKKQKISLTTPSVRPPMIPHSRPGQINGSTSTIIQAKSPQAKESKVTQQVIQQFKTFQDNVNTSIAVASEIMDTNSEQRSMAEQRAVSTSHLIVRGSLEQSRKMSKSAIHLNGLKPIQFRRERVLKPQRTEYRKIQQKDRLLLDFLGIKY